MDALFTILALAAIVAVGVVIISMAVMEYSEDGDR